VKSSLKGSKEEWVIFISGTVVAQYAALLGMLFFILSIMVIRVRRNTQISLGTGNNPLLEKYVRIHGNFAEYVPMVLFIILNLEFQRFPLWIIHITCLSLLIGRLIYTVALINESIQLRVAGMMLTFISLGLSSLLLFARVGLGIF
jgi:uncharacterized protein